METSKNTTIFHIKGDKPASQIQSLIIEEPLSIRIEGSPYSVVMRTPGDEIAHVAGFCLAEGLIDCPEDIVTIGFCSEEGTNVATVTLTEPRKQKVCALLERKGFVSQTSCGICGKEVVKDLHQITSPVDMTLQVTADQIRNCVNRISEFQPIHRQTRSAHAALIFDRNMQLLSSAEDVGRHNALDKAIGKVFMDKHIQNARFAVMSSRLSYELVQKAARAGLEMLIGISRPTSLGVDLANAMNMTLVCVKNHDLLIFCGHKRLNLPEQLPPADSGGTQKEESECLLSK